MPLAAECLAAAIGSPAVERRPWPYQSSMPMEEVVLADSRTVLVKELHPSHRRIEPSFRPDPRRELAAYATMLQELPINVPNCVAIKEPEGRAWLILERIDGIPLWQVGDLVVWKEAARWLARFHAHPAPASQELLDYDADYLRRIFRRATALPRADAIGERVAAHLVELPKSLIHGEFYPSNIIVEDHGGRARIRAVDWETCGIGPGVLDIAALSAGSWSNEQREEIENAYLDACPDAQRPTRTDIDFGRLLLAAQWSGWCADWTPPRQHAQDWRREALTLVEKLRL